MSEHLDVDKPLSVADAFQALNLQCRRYAALTIADKDHDMKGCFTHVPLAETVKAVEYVCKEFADMGLLIAHVPRKHRSSRPVLGHNVAGAGYIPIDLHILPGYAHHHGKFSFAWLGNKLQRQIDGLPMGSAFSVFLQRCWAVFRELYFSRNHDNVTLQDRA